MSIIAACAIAMLAMAAPVSGQQYVAPSGPLSIDDTEIAAGDRVEASGAGFEANSAVGLVLVTGGGEIELGEATTDSNGRFTLEVTIPSDFEGTGVLEARGTAPDGATRVLSVPIVNGSVSSLPATGSSAAVIAWSAAVLVATGVALFLLGRRLMNRRAW